MQSLPNSSIFQYPAGCQHKQWQAKILPMRNGVDALREFCVSCGASSGGSGLGPALPMTADVDMTVQSYKYPNKTFGEIHKIAPSYLVWIVRESKCADRVRKSAARILCGVPYTPPENNAIYDKSLCYDATVGWICIRRIQAEIPSTPPVVI